MKRLILVTLFFALAFLLKSVVSADAYAAVTIKVTLDNRDGAVNTSAVVDIYKTVSGSPSLMISQYSTVSRYTTPGTGQAVVQYTNPTDSGTNTPYTIRWSNPYCGGGGTGTTIFNSASGFYEITQSVRCTNINSIVNMSALSCATTTGTVSWNVSNNNGGYPNISSFKVYKALSGSSFGTTYQSVPFVGTSDQSTFTAPYSVGLTGLSTGVWVVRVLAVPNSPDQANVTASDVNLACGTAIVPPTPPQAVYSSCTSTNSNVALSWNGATPGTYTYKVEILDQSGNTDLGPVSWAGVSGVTSVDQEAGITLANTSLASNHSYFAHVVATSTINSAVYYSVTTPFTVPTLCGGAGGGSATAPYNLSAVQTCNNGSPQVTFSALPLTPGNIFMFEVTTAQFTGDYTTTTLPPNSNIRGAYAMITAPYPSAGPVTVVWSSSNGFQTVNGGVTVDANPQTVTASDNGFPIAGQAYYWRVNMVSGAGLSKWIYPNGTYTNGVYAGTPAWSGVPVQLTACTSQPYHDVKVEVVPNTFRSAGAITSIAVTSGGNNYSGSSTVSIGGGGGGIGATATLNIINGTITYVTVTNGGSGYTSAPTFTFANVGSGSGADLTATIGDGLPQAPSFTAGQTVKFQAQVTNLNVNGGIALPSGSLLYFYYQGGASMPNCSVGTTGSAVADAGGVVQSYAVGGPLAQENGSKFIDIKFNVGSTVGSPTAYLYVVPSCGFASPPDPIGTTDPNWDNNDTSFTYNVGVNKFFQTTGGDVGASGIGSSSGGTVSVGVVSNPLYQSTYGIISNVLSNISVPATGFTISGYGQKDLVPDGGVYNYFADKFRAKAMAVNTMPAPCALSSVSSGFYYCGGSLTVSTSTTISNNGGGPAVFFIDGNLNINADLKLPTNTADAAVYIVAGDINVSSTARVKDLHGIFVARGSFNDCNDLCGVATGDALTIEGALYVDGIGVGLNLSRYFSTPATNGTNPSDIINFDPKYLVVLNGLLASSDVGWKEVSP